MFRQWVKSRIGRFKERMPLPEFLQEWRAVRAGMARHRAQGQEACRYRLRRNLHRLEKGLMMPGARPVYGAEYIAETVAAYASLRQGAACEDTRDEMLWAHNVLRAYFGRVGPNPAVDGARRLFDSLAGPTPLGEVEVALPFRQKEIGPAPLSYEQILAATRHRKSVRWFLPRPVPHAALDQAMAAAIAAPSACNRQAFAFLIMDAPERVRSVAALLLGVSGFDHQIPVLVAVVGSLRGYEHARDRHLIYVDGGLAAMNFMLALDALGLAACPVNWPDRPQQNRNLAALLGLEDDERAVMFLAVGYPDPEGMVAHSQRKSLDLLRRYLP
ncbi:MAG: nitroreductase family protein [Verrucomicrobia bacterium]|nr:nitroreductase family protein [Verrucomicrobiota bacterium]